MRNPVRWLFDSLRERRRSRSMQVLKGLKMRYHTFRILLTHNEASLDLLHSLDSLLGSPLLSREKLSEKVEELLDVTYELVDGLNRLTNDRYGALYEKHGQLAEEIRGSLASVLSLPAHVSRCFPLSILGAEYRGIVGGKAATLGTLMEAGLPVPDGFAVSAEACREILAENGLDAIIGRALMRLESRHMSEMELEAEARSLGSLILSASLPPGWEEELRKAYELLTSNGWTAVSLRSSALVEDRPEHSFAGQFESVLNVTSLAAVQKALKRVIASNYTPRAISYRLNAGLPLTHCDMAVLCQRMIPARAAGGLFTVDPANPGDGRMLISAVHGLGILAVEGSAPADIYRPGRDFPDSELPWVQIAEKKQRAVGDEKGGIRMEAISPETRNAPVLSPEEVGALVRYGRRIESLLGRPQDIEWAISGQGDFSILQSRDIRLAAKDQRIWRAVRGKTILEGGATASPGRCVGKVKVVRSVRDIEVWRRTIGQPGIMVLHGSMVDAAGWLPEFEGVVVDLGNPADHLSCVARETSRPMLTGMGRATEVLQDGRWVILDADAGLILEASEEVRAGAPTPRKLEHRGHGQPRRGVALPPEALRLREQIEPLHLTDAYGPTFSFHECKSLHDIIRYVHEMAVLSMFDIGDLVMEEADSLLHKLDEGMPFHFLIIDLGGGIAPDRTGFKIRLGDLLSTPLLALWKGMATPELRWSLPPPAPKLSGLFSRAVLDARSARPVGSQNYAFITRDYLNLNARVDFHFTMVDAVCGSNPRENYIRFRFKGGGANEVQRDRRARFVTEVLGARGFFAEQQGDLVHASLVEARKEEGEEQMIMIGRLIGFSRLLDAVMHDDGIPHKVARAFLDGDYGLQGLSGEPARA